MRNFFQDILNENATGFADQLSLAGSGTVVFQDALRFPGCPEQIVGGLGPAIISVPILGRFLRIRQRFSGCPGKHRGGLGPAIISGPIRGRFFRIRLRFFRIRQPANVILGYAGVPSP